MLEEQFKKSSYCHGGGCVEVRVRLTGEVEVADGKDPSLKPHRFTQAEWNDFLNGVKAGEFDYPDRSPS